MEHYRHMPLNTGEWGGGEVVVKRTHPNPLGPLGTEELRSSAKMAPCRQHGTQLRLVPL